MYTEKVMDHFQHPRNVGEIENEHWNFVEKLIKDTNNTIILPDYPLAPKYTYKDVFNMIEPLYKEIVDKNTPKENYIKNAVIAFVVGGFLGSLSELLLRCYSMWLNLPRKESGVLVILTLITIASILTALGIFDTLVTKVKAALIIPITGFAHSMTSAALEYKNEGLVLGIGANIFKLAGTVILYGVVSVYIFGLIRLLVIGG